MLTTFCRQWRGPLAHYLVLQGKSPGLSFGLEKDGEPLLLPRAPELFDHPGPGAS